MSRFPSSYNAEILSEKKLDHSVSGFKYIKPGAKRKDVANGGSTSAKKRGEGESDKYSQKYIQEGNKLLSLDLPEFLQLFSIRSPPAPPRQ